MMRSSVSGSGTPCSSFVYEGWCPTIPHFEPEIVERYLTRYPEETKENNLKSRGYSLKQKTISERENFLRAVEFNNPEWIPIIFEFLPSVWKKYGNTLRDILLRHPLIDTGFWLDQMLYDTTDPLFTEGTYYKDDWDCLWYNAQDGIIGQVIEHPISDWKAFTDLKVPNPLDQIDWKMLAGNMEEERRKELPLLAFPESFAHGGFFDRLQFLRGLENLLVDFMTEPPQLNDLIEIVLDYNMKYIQKWLEIGIDVMWFHGDIGTQNGLMISPRIFRKYLKPAYKKMFQACRQEGVHVWYSCDGNILGIVDDLVECGVSIHDPQVRANTIDGIAQAYKGKLCPLVDIDEQMLPFCKPEDIDQQFQEIVEKVGSPEGGLMIYAIPSMDVPLENIEALCSSWERHCFFQSI